MKSKKFSEVFSNIVLDDYLNNIVKNISVFNIKFNKNNNKLSVYIISHIIIKRIDLLKIKDLIEISYKVSVDLFERFELDPSFTTKQIFESYKDDLEYDIKLRGGVMSKLFSDAKFNFIDDSECIIQVPKVTAYEIRLEEFKKVIEQIFINRFSSPIYIKFDLVKKDTEKTSDVVRMNMLTTFNIDKRNSELIKNNIVKDDLKDDIKIEELDQTKKTKEKKRRGGFSKKVVEEIKGERTKIIDINDIDGKYIIDAKVVSSNYRELKSSKILFSFVLTDFTDSIRAKIFVDQDEVDEVKDILKENECIRLVAIFGYNNFENEFQIKSILSISKIEDFSVNRIDNSIAKRIELCTHTKMSKMESVTDIKELINTAAKWGHEAIAITDFGVVHGFPDAMNVAKKFENFKIIYGMTAKVVDDSVNIVNILEDRSIDDTIVVFDIETTGFNAMHDKIIEIGAVKIKERELSVEYFQEFVNPKRPLSYDIVNLTKITDRDLVNAPTIDVILPKFFEFCEGATLAAHNANFDMSFIIKNARDLGIKTNFNVIDTLPLARRLIKDMKSYKLEKLAKKFKIDLVNAHRAKDDAVATAKVLIELLKKVTKQGCNTLVDINNKLALTKDDIKKIYPSDISLLVKNEVGRINLYTMVSKSHLEYLDNFPKIPLSMLKANREGLLVGSGNINGFLQQAILRGKSDKEVDEIINFYDYIEVQPPSHYKADKTQFSDSSMIEELIRNIIKAAQRNNKIVVATGDVYFLNPEDEIYRKIVKLGDKKKLKYSAPYYFMTTDEMLNEFAFLGDEISKQIVIENTNHINSIIEDIKPVRPDKCPPVIENSDKELRQICYDTAHEMYGEKLPQQVETRLEKELNSIISNGFAVMYIIAQKLVKKSNEDGYMVGSRGSVGSSLVATMAKITEVNPLPPHYYCKKCHFTDFDSKIIKDNQGLCGCDLPRRVCPSCGEELVKDGFDIPFETFLGFKGNKEPDIDLNFSGEYQSIAHRETENIFGKGYTFRAGTISGVADKTAYGYTKDYLKENGLVRKNCEIERLAMGVQGVKRTTGQHPGGIIVLPLGENIHSFTPIQRPADDENSNVITTHFDYHSIDHNLLKLDILGHDDPTMIKRLEDLTGIDAKSIPLDEPKVMSIFHSPEVLGVNSKDILGCPIGCRGIPEFGTDFTIQMVLDTKPKNFSDLVKISGLSHGADVWIGNAKEIIDSGKATISDCICTRDDIMVYLISKGIEEELAFTIMESVRKGKGLKPEWEKIMLDAGIADWYIWSCNKIAYMFPKAHAVAYVMMAYRIAYFKVYYPLEYYAAFFSIRASAFDYEKMCMGRQVLEEYILQYEQKDNPSNTEKDVLKDMKIVQEFYARGYSFMPVDIYKADDKQFKIFNGKLMPSLSVITGLGEKAAELVKLESKKGSFISKEDLKNRCKLSVSTIEKLSELGILEGLTDKNQTTIYDFL